MREGGVGLAPWWRSTLGWLVWSVPSLAGAPAAVHAMLRAAHGLALERGLFWLPPESAQALDALRIALGEVGLCVVTARDDSEGCAALLRSAQRALTEASATTIPQLEAMLADVRTPPAVLIRSLDGLEALACSAELWSRTLGPLRRDLAGAVPELARRVDEALTARLVA
ncbi:MAG: hypothetical protein IT380_11190 [Myxococcales bacterium]|nr:hypothetical protein [Myxococcales bacterium]